MAAERGVGCRGAFSARRRYRRPPSPCRDELLHRRQDSWRTIDPHRALAAVPLATGGVRLASVHTNARQHADSLYAW